PVGSPIFTMPLVAETFSLSGTTRTPPTASTNVNLSRTSTGTATPLRTIVGSVVDWNGPPLTLTSTKSAPMRTKKSSLPAVPLKIADRRRRGSSASIIELLRRERRDRLDVRCVRGMIVIFLSCCTRREAVRDENSKPLLLLPERGFGALTFLLICVGQR